jgi:hypothetical protein
VFAVGALPTEQRSNRGVPPSGAAAAAATAAAAAAAADARPALLLVYASSSFADERVCLRAKLLQLRDDDGGSSWSISTETDLLHPPSKDTPHYDVTCIVGHTVRDA